MINYFCPSFIQGYPIYKALFKLKLDYPYIFYDNVNIHTIYGNISGLTWNGGSIDMADARISREKLIFLLEEYRKMGVNIQFTMTNLLLEKIDMYDRVGNEILSLLAENYSDNVEILVTSPILKQHILENYPELKISKSIIDTKEELDFNNLNEYSHIVLPIRYNENFEKLKEIPKEDLDRYEMLITDPCPVNCPRLYEHYKGFAQTTLFIPCIENTKCTNIQVKPFRKNNHIRLTYNEIIEKYVPLGFSNFKISGRILLFNDRGKISLLTSLIPFLIKPEYQLEALMTLYDNSEEYKI